MKFDVCSDSLFSARGRGVTFQQCIFFQCVCEIVGDCVGLMIHVCLVYSAGYRFCNERGCQLCCREQNVKCVFVFCLTVFISIELFETQQDFISNFQNRYKEQHAVGIRRDRTESFSLPFFIVFVRRNITQKLKRRSHAQTKNGFFFVL